MAAKDNPFGLKDFKQGEFLTADDMNSIVRAIRAKNRPSFGNSNPDRISFSDVIREELYPIEVYNPGSAIPPYSVFTVLSTSTKTTNEAHWVHIEADINNEGLTYFTNGPFGIGPTSWFTCRNISSVWPAKVLYTGTAPSVGEEVGPLNDGTGTMGQDGEGYVNIAPAVAADTTIWVQSLGGGASMIEVGVLQNDIAPCTTGTMDLHKEKDPLPASACTQPKTGDPSIKVVNHTGITLHAGPLHWAIPVPGFQYKLAFPEEIEECYLPPLPINNGGTV